jgi:serine/threonine protein kinase
MPLRNLLYKAQINLGRLTKEWKFSMVTVDIELENYIFEREIGRGDLTIVHQGRRKTDDAQVAIKVVAPQFTFDEHFVRRFKDITRQTIKLEHPNIVRIYEVNQEGNILYVVREFIEARLLSELLETEGPLSPQRMLAIARQIAAALDYAHQKSIMHGDLSARRIYIGADDHVIVADFGQTQAMAGTSLAKQGYAVGSPEILAPERVHGQGPSRQSDLYSLGILCYQMLSNTPPFSGEPAAVLHAQAYEQPHPLHMLNPGISVPLSEAIERMLSKGLELRYTTGSEFARALSVAIEGTAPVRRIATGKMAELELSIGPSRSIWQRPWIWILIAIPIVGLLLLAGFLAVSLWLTLVPVSSIVVPENVTPTEIPLQPEQVIVVEPTPTPAVETNQAAAVVLVQSTASATLSLTATPTPVPPTPTTTPTPIPIPTPGPPVVADWSPFTNLSLAHAISEEGQPEKVGLYFAPNSDPIYLFFDYGDIEPGTVWTHRWTWGDVELDVYEDIWPDSYFETGTAWVYYRPIGGFQPGPYKVTLEINGQVAATATFVVREGGL